MLLKYQLFLTCNEDAPDCCRKVKYYTEWKVLTDNERNIRKSRLVTKECLFRTSNEQFVWSVGDTIFGTVYAAVMV